MRTRPARMSDSSRSPLDDSPTRSDEHGKRARIVAEANRKAREKAVCPFRHYAHSATSGTLRRSGSAAAGAGRALSGAATGAAAGGGALTTRTLSRYTAIASSLVLLM